jgi:hypothetical protein
MTEQTRTDVAAAASSPPPRRRVGGTAIAACVGLVLGLLALGPGLGPGYLLSYDMVFVPAPQVNAAALGTAGTLPRAVPSDAVVAALARALPADLVQKLLLLGIFVLACAGAARLLSKERWPAQLAAGVLYAWNPFVAERLILGQWALLLGYAGLPWVLGAATRLDGSLVRRALRLAAALLPAAVGGFAAMAISGLVALPAAALAGRAARSRSTQLPAVRQPGVRQPAVQQPAVQQPAVRQPAVRQPAVRQPAVRQPAVQQPAVRLRTGRSRLAWVAVTAMVLAVLSLPWLIPSLTRPVHTSPAGVAAFAARADTPLGTAGSLLLLGGGWNAQTVPAGYGGAATAATLCLAAIALAGFLLLGRRRWPGLGIAAGAGLLIALLGALGPGRDLLRSMITAWPGFAVLRDGQQFVGPLALAEATGLGLIVGRVLRRDGSRTARDGAAILAAGLVVVPVLVLPGLGWGAAGRLRPVEYPADWLAARRLINGDPRPGRALLLPWGAYRRFGWNRGEALLDPWPRLLARQVVWNDGVQVGTLRIPPEDPAAIAINGPVTGGGPLTRALQAQGYRYVIVDAGFGHGSRGGDASSRLPGCTVVLRGPGLVIYQVPG